MDSLAAARLPVLSLSNRNATVAVGPQQSACVTPEVSDEALIADVVAGDRERLAVLFQRYARLVRAVSLRILKSAVEAEDLVQDLFLFIQRKAGTFDSTKSSGRSWIVQMAYQRAIERRRYLATRQFYAQPALQSEVESVVSKPTTEDDYSPEAVFGRNGLEKALAELSEDQRETLRLYFFEGYTLAEISEKAGQPVGNVRHHYYRALDKLRKRMFTNHRPGGG